MFCSKSFVKGVRESLRPVTVAADAIMMDGIIPAAKVADTILMDGFVPAVKATDKAIAAAVCWTEKWVAPLVICAAQIAWVIWTDLIWWGILRAFAGLRAWVDSQVESCIDSAPIALLEPAPEQVETAPAAAQTMSAPSAVAVVEVEADPFSPAENEAHPDHLATLTTAQLRKACIAHNSRVGKNSPRYIQRAARLNKAEALAALNSVGVDA